VTALERAHGPYETEAAILADLETLAPSAGLEPVDAGRTRLLMLRQTLEALGVEAGDGDLFVLARFGHWEPDAVMVVRGLVERAYAAGIAAAPAAPSSAPLPAPVAASETHAEELVHWARQGSPLGDPAQCGAPEGRATRVASAVTCPACIAWMRDESWTGHSGTGAH
jgi:hypothetical protein